MKLTQIKGIGPKKAEYLSKMMIESVEDLRNYLPNYYENRSILNKLATALDGEKQYFELEITGAVKTYFVKKNMTITRVTAKDDTDNVNLVWYNDRFSAKNLLKGQVYKFFGYYNKEKKSMSNPIFCKLNEDIIGGIYPIYSVIKGISKKEFIKFKDEMFKAQASVDDYFSKDLLDEFSLYSLGNLYKVLHRPDNYFDLYKAKNSYLIRQYVISKLANSLNKEDNQDYIEFDDISLEEVINGLDFILTKDQDEAFRDIKIDMTSKKRMNRIIIGDVGSGKTIVAVLAVILAIKNGYQVAFMAPTEILARQHFDNYKDFLLQFGIESDLLIGSTKSSDRELIYRDLKSKKLNIIFGTHSLYQEKVVFNNLGLVVTDEQQRFGVFQRKLISEKGKSPDLLLLSATPIPRTLALTMYRDLDFSIIESMPHNRKKIESYLVTRSYEKRFVEFAKKNLLEGRQVYVVCPRVFEDGELDINSVESIYIRYKKFFKNDFVVDVLHGQMTAEEKEEKQNLFFNGKIDVLISTTIIEVGIDVKNATLMIIYDANYFGLSQLHQLRGRIGRGSHQSYCIFVASKNKEDDEKLKFIEKCDNGFEIAKKDMELRGAGDRFGFYQSGFTDSSEIDIYDTKLINISNEIFNYLLEKDELSNNKLLKSKVENKLLEYQKIIMN